MNESEKLGPDEISRRIVIGMGLVYDLYNELSGFLNGIVTNLESSDLDVRPLTRGGFRLPLPAKKMRTPADRYLATDAGVVVELGATDIDEEEVEVDEDEETGGEERKGLQITSDSQFLAIRTILYDRQKPDPNSFVPVVTAAVLADLTRVPRGKGGPEGRPSQKFQIRRGYLLKLAKTIDGQVQPGQSIAGRAPRCDLSATVTGITSRPLSDFDSEEKLNTFTDELVALAENPA